MTKVRKNTKKEKTQIQGGIHNISNKSFLLVSRLPAVIRLFGIQRSLQPRKDIFFFSARVQRLEREYRPLSLFSIRLLSLQRMSLKGNTQSILIVSLKMLAETIIIMFLNEMFRPPLDSNQISLLNHGSLSCGMFCLQHF